MILRMVTTHLRWIPHAFQGTIHTVTTVVASLVRSTWAVVQWLLISEAGGRSRCSTDDHPLPSPPPPGGRAEAGRHCPASCRQDRRQRPAGQTADRHSPVLLCGVPGGGVQLARDVRSALTIYKCQGRGHCQLSLWGSRPAPARRPFRHLRTGFSCFFS